VNNGRTTMIDANKLIADLENIISTSRDRTVSLQAVADEIRRSGNYRWVGLYDVDQAAGLVRNVVFSGPGAPAYRQFAVTKGLTGAAVAQERTVNVGDVSADARYLTAFGTTKSEIIVPIFDQAKQQVIGTIDVESELRDAFSPEVERLLERCADVVRPLWQS
jgi:L-methionine (R)-S-oxide reductase